MLYQDLPNSPARGGLFAADRSPHRKGGLLGPEVTRRAGGSALPWNRRLFSSIVSAAVLAAGSIRVTVKMRIGVDSALEPCLGRINSPGKVFLPEGWLSDRDDDALGSRRRPLGRLKPAISIRSSSDQSHEMTGRRRPATGHEHASLSVRIVTHAMLYSFRTIALIFAVLISPRAQRSVIDSASALGASPSAWSEPVA